MLRNILINNVIFGDIGLTGGWSWFQQQGQIVVWIALGYLAGKRIFRSKVWKNDSCYCFWFIIGSTHQ